MANTLVIKWQTANPPGKMGGTTLLVKVDGHSVVGDSDNPQQFPPDSLEQARDTAMRILREIQIANPPPDPAAAVNV
jgi:hypothetical protein